MTLQEIIQQLSAQAGPRGATFAGRVIPQGQTPTLADILRQLPSESPDAEGMGAIGGAAAGMAKVFKPAPGPVSGIARLARQGRMPESEFESMLPALIDQKTGQVIHGMRPGAGGHNPLYSQAATLKDFQPTRGFVDPATWDAYTEAMLEEILARKHGMR